MTKTWTLSERPMTKKALELKGLRVNRPLIRTYLLCALSRHSQLGSESNVGAIDLVAANTFRSLKRPTIIEAVKFAKSIDLPLVAHLTIHWSGTFAFDDHDGTRFAKVREGLAKVLLRRGIPPRGPGAVSAKPTPTSCIAICSFICRSSTALARSSTEIKAALERLVDRHGDGILGEFAVKLKIWPDPDGLYLIKGGGPECVEAVSSDQEGMAQAARHHSRQAVRHLSRTSAPQLAFVYLMQTANKSVT